MKKLMLDFAVFFLISLTVAGCGFLKKEGKTEQSGNKNNETIVIENLDEYKNLDEKPVTRAVAAKMLSIGFTKETDFLSFSDAKKFKDVSESAWYRDFVNCAVSYGFMSGFDENFRPEDYLTIYEAQQLMDRLYKNNSIKIKITDENKNLPVSYALWQDLLEKVMDKMRGGKSLEEYFGIENKEVIPLATSANTNSLSDGVMITDKGIIYCSGFDMDKYIDKKILVQTRGSQLFGILNENNLETPLIENAYIVGASEGKIKIFVQGALRTYPFNGTLQEGVKVASIQIKDGIVMELTPVTDIKTGEVKRNLHTSLEVDGLGLIKLKQDANIYGLYGSKVSVKESGDILVGMKDADFYINKGEIAAVVINNKPKIEEIRVALNNTGYKSLFHSKIELTCDKGFNIKTEKDEIQYAPGQVLKIDEQNNDTLFDSLRIKITPAEGGLLSINSIKRGERKAPLYRGTIEIAKAQKVYTITNVLPFEEYLYSVVSAQSFANSNLESLKAQAIASRSIAYNQYYLNSFSPYGGHVDDSHLSQPYGEKDERKDAIEAVEATKGVCLVYENEVASANYFLASCGFTASSGELWQDRRTLKYPANSPNYLKAAQWFNSEEKEFFENEEKALIFFKNQNILCWDSKSPWFRWNLKLTSEQLKNSVNNNLPQRQKLEPKLVEIKDKGGNVIKDGVKTLGDITGVKILKRGGGGNVMEIEITGTTHSALIKGEANIRAILKPFEYSNGKEPIVVNLVGNLKAENCEALPSSFFALQEEKDSTGKLINISLAGGGNGHGTGLSQEGANAMAIDGVDYIEILNRYFSGCELKVINKE